MKYENLQRRLASETRAEVPMTFAEIEHLIGAALPGSARRHRAWWSNNGSNNVAVRYWRAAGRKTAKVDMASERVSFVKDVSSASMRARGSRRGADEGGAFDLSAFPEAVRVAIERDGGGAEAVIGLLQDGLIERRRRLLDRLAQGPMTASSSADLIREDRDAR